MINIMINKFYVFILLSFLSLQACSASHVISEDFDAGELGELPPRIGDPSNPGLQFPSNGNQNANNGYNPDNSNDDDVLDVDSGLVQDDDAGSVVVVVPPQEDSGTVDSGTVVVDSGINSPDEDDAGTVVADSGVEDQDDAGVGDAGLEDAGTCTGPVKPPKKPRKPRFCFCW